MLYIAPLCLLFLSPCLGYNNGLARRPPLGWQSWCSVGKCGTDHCFDQQIRSTAKAMVENGLHDIGYDWIVLDDCWHPVRDNTTGTLIPNADFFPNGITPVIDYVHSLGLKFGLYTSVGDLTCHGGWSPGSFGFYEQDAQLFADWKVDYVKMDYCGHHTSSDGHRNFSRAMNATGRHMVLELCRGPYQKEDHWGYAPDVAQIWRSTGDHHDNFASTLEQLDSMKGKGNWSGPYGWAYGDMMMTGGEGCADYDPMLPEHCPGQTDNEYRTEFSLYAVVGSPMMIGTDIRNMTSIMSETMLNKEVLAINQDYLAAPGDQVEQMCGKSHVTAWVRHLSNGNIAVGIPNLADSPANITVCFSDIISDPQWEDDGGKITLDIRDIWKKSDIRAVENNWTREVDVHDTMLLVLAHA